MMSLKKPVIKSLLTLSVSSSVASAGIPKLCNRYYSSCGRIMSVEEVDSDLDLVTFWDGHDSWSFYQDGGDYEVGDCISVIFEERGKVGYIYDDAIVYTRYTPQTITGNWE